MGARCAGVQPLRPACSASRSVSRIRIVGSDCGTRGAGGDAASWGDAARRLHGRFWVLRERGDGAGTDLVSDAEDGPCAVGLGMTSSIASLLTRQGQVAAAPSAAGPQAAGWAFRRMGTPLAENPALVALTRRLLGVTSLRRYPALCTNGGGTKRRGRERLGAHVSCTRSQAIM